MSVKSKPSSPGVEKTRARGNALDEASDLRDVLARDEVAWRHFVARYDEPLREIVRHATEATHPLTSDQIDDVLGDFWLAAVASDMRLLRAFNPARGASLLTWLTFHVAHVAHEHAQRIRARPTVPLREARNLPAPRVDHEGIIDLKRELMNLLRSPEARRTIVDIVHATIEQDRSAEADDGLLDAEGAADVLAMTPGAVRKAVLRGSLPCRRIGRKLRFVRSELLAAAKRSTSSGARLSLR
jgi:hypothetical protein